MESALAGVTAGNGAIYAVRARAPTCRSPPPAATTSPSPSQLAKRGHALALRARGPRRGEDGADAGGRVRPQAADDGRALGHRRRRGDDLARAATRRSTPSSSLSHRLLRYLTPFLHLVAFVANLALLGQGGVYVVTYGDPGRRRSPPALLGGSFPLGPLRIARYYALTTASIAAGLWDRLRQGPPGAWEKAPGTR